MRLSKKIAVLSGVRNTFIIVRGITSPDGAWWGEGQILEVAVRPRCLREVGNGWEVQRHHWQCTSSSSSTSFKVGPHIHLGEGSRRLFRLAGTSKIEIRGARHAAGLLSNTSQLQRAPGISVRLKFDVLTRSPQDPFIGRDPEGRSLVLADLEGEFDISRFRVPRGWRVEAEA